MSRFITVARRSFEKYPELASWLLPKIHLMAHYMASIRRGGCIQEYNAEPWEHSHIETIKQAARGSNIRDIARHVTRRALRRTVMQELSLGAAVCKTYATASRRVRFIHQNSRFPFQLMNRVFCLFSSGTRRHKCTGWQGVRYRCEGRCLCAGGCRL